MTDLELIRRYDQTKDHEAFAELVRRHIDWVYSAARRRVRDRHLAEDVTQAVFIALAQRAASLNRDEPLSGWLLQVTRCACINALRGESRRQCHEKRAAAMRSESLANQRQSDWDELTPYVDEEVSRLGRNDRHALLLRFYERRSFVEVGESMGTSEEAARKRVNRAVERLRKGMESKRLTVSAQSLATALWERLTEVAPPGLADGTARVAAGEIAGTAGTIAKGALQLMMWAKLKIAAVVLAATIVAGTAIGAATVAVTGAAGATEPSAIATTRTDAPRTDPVPADSILVVGPDGTPAAGAQIYVMHPGTTALDLRNAVTFVGRGPSSRPTDGTAGDDGRFVLPQPRPRMLAVLHPTGFARFLADELGASNRIALQPWGGIQGQLSVALRSGRGQKVIYASTQKRHPADEFELRCTMEAPVDSEGKFSLDRVPPGRAMMYRDVPLARERTEMHAYDHGVPITVGAGESATVQIGGQGVLVRGHVEPPPGSEWRLADTFAYVQLEPVPDPADLPELPAATRQMDMQQLGEWSKTPEGQAWTRRFEEYEDAQKNSYVNGIRGDGLFELVEVRPGRYRLSIHVSAVNAGPAWGLGKPLGGLAQEITVPATPAGQAAEVGTFGGTEWKVR